MGFPTMEQLVDIERGDTPPDAELTVASRVRRRLFHGAVLDPYAIQDEFGVHISTVASATLTLRRLGFVVEHVPGPRGVMYRLTNPEHQPTPEDFEADRARARAESAATRERKRERDAAVAAALARKAQDAAAAKSKPKASNTSKTVEPRPTGGGDVADRASGVPPLPDLGQPVTVYALALNDDGSVTLGLRNGDRRWMASVTGTMET